MPQRLSELSSSIPYLPSEAAPSQTTRAWANLPVAGMVMQIGVPDGNPGIVAIKAPCSCTTKVFPAAWNLAPLCGCVPLTRNRTNSGMRELRRLSCGLDNGSDCLGISIRHVSFKQELNFCAATAVRYIGRNREFLYGRHPAARGTFSGLRKSAPKQPPGTGW